jgi:hypothetical protein
MARPAVSTRFRGEENYGAIPLTYPRARQSFEQRARILWVVMKPDDVFYVALPKEIYDHRVESVDIFLRHIRPSTIEDGAEKQHQILARDALNGQLTD